MNTYMIKNTAYHVTAVAEGGETLEALLLRFLEENWP